MLRLEALDQVQHFLKRARGPAAMAQENQGLARFQRKSPLFKHDLADKTSKTPVRPGKFAFPRRKGIE